MLSALRNLRLSLAVLGAVAFGLIAAGCGTSGPSTECADSIRCVVVEPGEPVRIGAMLVISGGTAHLGEDQQGAIEIALDDYGLLHGHEIEVTIEDSLCSAEGGQTAATKVSTDPRTVGVLGTSCSSAATAALPVISEAGLVMIAASNTSPTLTDPDKNAGGAWLPGYYRTSHNSLLEGPLAARFAMEFLGIQKVATIHDGSIYALKLTEIMARRFEELGGTVSYRGSVNVGETEMAPLLTEISSEQPGLVYFPVFQPEGNFLAVQARNTAGLENASLMGAGGLFLSDFAVNTGPSAVGMFIGAPHLDGTRYDELLAKWEARFGGQPPAGYHAHMYDATFLLLDAVAAASTVDQEGRLTVGLQGIRDYLDSVDGFEGITGSLSCSDTGDCGSPETLVVYELTQEVVEGAWPPPVVYPAD